MGSASLLAVWTKGSVASTAVLLFGLGLLVAMAAALLRAANDGEARSRGDVGGRLRALDELVSRGSMTPDEYASSQALLLHEN